MGWKRGVGASGLDVFTVRLTWGGGVGEEDGERLEGVVVVPDEKFIHVKTTSQGHSQGREYVCLPAVVVFSLPPLPLTYPRRLAGGSTERRRST